MGRTARIRLNRSALAVVAGAWVALSTGALAQADAGPPPAPAPPPPGPKTFVVDGKKSLLVIQVFKEGAAATLAHDHTVQATEVAGQVVANPASPETASVNVTVQTKSLVNDDPQVRRQFGLDPTVPERDKRAVEESMKGDTQLDVEKYPTISFTSTAVEKNGDNSSTPQAGADVAEARANGGGLYKLTLVGDFTLHGVTKRIKMPIAVKIVDNTLTGDGKIRFLQSDYGIKPYSAFLGAVKNKDELVLNVHLVAVAP